MINMELSIVPSQFLSVVLEESDAGHDASTSSDEGYVPKWRSMGHNNINNNVYRDGKNMLWHVTRHLPKTLLAECTVEISRSPLERNDKPKKLRFEASVDPIFIRPKKATPVLPRDIQKTEWLDDGEDMRDMLTRVEAVYSDNDEVEETPLPPSNKFSYRCEHCPNVYSNRGALWQHSVATHSVEKTCECKICGRKFYRNCSLALHLKSHGEEEPCSCKECGKTFTRALNLERHMKVHATEELFGCDKCERSFSDKLSLIRHTTVHHGSQMYTCRHCAKQFPSQELLYGHVRAEHEPPEVHPCPQCGEHFPSLAEASRHELVHAANPIEKPYLCNFCNKSFAQKSILRKHLVIHTGERLTCTTCGIDFTQKSSLLRHIKRMHVASPNSSESTDEMGSSSSPSATVSITPVVVANDKPSISITPIVITTSQEPLKQQPCFPELPKTDQEPTLIIEQRSVVKRGPYEKFEEELPAIKLEAPSVVQQSFAVIEKLLAAKPIPESHAIVRLPLAVFEELPAAKHVVLEHSPANNPHTTCAELAVVNQEGPITPEQPFVMQQDTVIGV